jgi:hypothetical protein
MSMPAILNRVGAMALLICDATMFMNLRSLALES